MPAGQSPGQPAEKNWKFIRELQTPLHKKILLNRNQKKEGEAVLKCGVALDFLFADKNLLSAYADFRQFLKACGIGRGPYKIITEKARTRSFESFTVDVAEDSCRIIAGDTEGIRRGLVFVEDEIQRSGGPFLKTGGYKRSPFIKTRISRCFFGPIKRPPMNRDELADDTDYYPEEYLNRLAHEAVNGLWLTVQFSDLCPSKFFPGHGRDRFRRLEKLNKTVTKCALYGIKLYLFCIEPRGFGKTPEYLLPAEELNKNKYFAGHRQGDTTYFCTSSREGREYLEESAYYLFSSVPGLGGIIDINLGERPTHCYSSTANFFNNNCPRCSKRKPWEVFYDTASAIAAGMHRANPAAEMISWLYVPAIHGKDKNSAGETEKVIREIAANMPDDVIFQYNFESGGKEIQAGKERLLLDYWLAWPGPGRIFKDCAKSAARNGACVSAKIQVGCSHEVATVPFVPVPGNLYKKYSAMRKLKVTSVMQCWYFGNYPGLMNKAAGELSFLPFPPDEDEFLLKLAHRDWGTDAEKAASAWKWFQKGYSSFPFNLSFAWYGPVHNSVVWQLYLKPVDAPISPSWKFTFPQESGDRIGECICYDHTLQEILVLLKQMAENWDRGVKILQAIEPEYSNNHERMLDIGLAKALNIQFSSAYNFFRFYDLREALPYLDIAEQKNSLEIMKGIVSAEIKNSLSLRELCLTDSRLGFHSEAEGYKYFPAKLKWRAEILKDLLREDFPEVEKMIDAGEKLFSVYTGEAPEGKKYTAAREKNSSLWETLDDGRTKWKAWHDRDNISFEVQCKDGDGQITLKIEPCRLWPAQTFQVSKNGDTRHDNFKTIEDNRWRTVISKSNKSWKAVMSIPFVVFEGYYSTDRPMRINVIHGNAAWISLHPWEYRLRFGTDNPADSGWLFMG
ncbi:MAG: hypothetical protein JW957_03630 [Candidatus Omnitrophica bacterium]|nr:hypothetical protein [Candidatus Omnitrophota bacterium]